MLIVAGRSKAALLFALLAFCGCSAHLFPQWKSFNDTSGIPTAFNERPRPYNVETVNGKIDYANTISTDTRNNIFLTYEGNTTHYNLDDVTKIKHRSHARGLLLGTFVGIAVTAFATIAGASSQAGETCNKNSGSFNFEIFCDPASGAAIGAFVGTFAIPISIGIGTAAGSEHGWRKRD